MTCGELIIELQKHAEGLPCYVNPDAGRLSFEIESVVTAHLSNHSLTAQDITPESLAVLIRF